VTRLSKTEARRLANKDQLADIELTQEGNKYNNVRVYDPLYAAWFDSLGERDRYTILVAMQRRGEISGLRRQVRFPIRIGGMLVCTYVADFVYRRKGARKDTVEDYKGVLTETYKLKKKLMKAVLNIEIQEVYALPRSRNKGRTTSNARRGSIP
jgi:hypothetical protein